MCGVFQSFCYFHDILPELFMSVGSWEKEHILYREQSVKFMQSEEECYLKKYLSQSFCLEDYDLLHL